MGEWWEEWGLWDDDFEPLPLIPESIRPCSRGQREWLEREATVLRAHKLSVIRDHIVNAAIHALPHFFLLT